jgi:hypothetical protein
MSDNPKRASMTTDQPGRTKGAVVERFPSTSGRISGVICLGTAAIVLTLAILPLDTGTPLGVAIVACFGALLTWVVSLRPAVWVTERDLVLRNMLVTFSIPLPAIEKVIIAQVLAVSAAGRRYVSPAVGYSLRQTVRSRSPRPQRAEKAKASMVESVQFFIEERIRYHVREASERQARDNTPVGDVRRTTAWLEIAGLVGFALAFVVWWFAV